MKKFLVALFAIIVMALSFKTEAKADALKEFNPAFLTDGKLDAPEGLYVKIMPYDGWNSQCCKVYDTQTDKIVNLVSEWETLGEDAFYEKYGFIVGSIYIQHDIKIDDGNWHYDPEWDVENFDTNEMPEYMAYYVASPAFKNEKICDQGNFIDLYYLDEDKSDWGFYEDVIDLVNGLSEGKKRVLDFDRHTFTFRSRYWLSFSKEGSDGYDDYIICSDWSPETSIGKNGKQVEPSKPEKLPAPILSNCVLLNTAYDEETAWSDCDVTWTIPNEVYEAAKYYWIVEDGFEPIAIITEVRINNGEWTDYSVANAASVYGGTRRLFLEDVHEDDTVEVRSRFDCNYDDSKNSDWSNIVSNKAGVGTLVTTVPETVTETNNAKPSAKTDDVVSSSKTVCKLCGVCPIQPKGICLFIWILLLILVAFLIVSLIKKIMKKQEKKTTIVTLIKVLLIIAFVAVLVIWIRFIILNKKNQLADNGSVIGNIIGNQSVEGTNDTNDADDSGSLLTLLSNGDVSNVEDLNNLINDYAEGMAEGENGASTPIGDSGSSTATGGISFSGYVENGNWPTALEWEEYGLPDLSLTENVDGTVRISSKDYIYPLNAKNGIMFEANPSEEQMAYLKGKLFEAGFEGEIPYDSDEYPQYYYVDYELDGVPMQVYITQMQEIDMGEYGENIKPKISVLIKVEPTD